jgi:hypothetical protein
MTQSKQVSALSSRSIINYRLTCGFFASVLPSGCAEKGQAGGFGRTFPHHRPENATWTGFSEGKLREKIR